MRKVSRSMRAAAPRHPGSTNRDIGAAARKVGGAGSLVLLTLLFWYIFYQNLPTNFGLNYLAPQGYVSTKVETGADVNSGNNLDRFAKVCMLAVSIFVIAKNWSIARSLARNINVGGAAVIALAGLSVAWSIEPEATLLRFISLLSIVLLCFALSLAGWHRQRFQQLAIPPLFYILIASLVLGIIFPDRIIEVGNDISQRDSWHGVTITKNQLGMTASLGVIICVNRWLAREGRANWAIAGAATAFTCLILSRSNTSLIATMLGVGFMALVMRVPVIKHRYTTHVVVAIAATLLLYELVIQDVVPGAHTLLAPIRGLTGKDSTLSARTIIWDIVKEHIQAAPYLGSGYGAYWLGPFATSPSYVFVWKMYFYPTEAHNGYLDIINDLGYVGLIFVLVFLFSYIRQALYLMQIDRTQAALYLGLLFQQMVMNMSESEWFSRDSTFTILILATVCLSRSLREARLQPQSVVT